MANLLWTVMYDTEYAMTDRPDDLKAGIRSSAILFGQYDRLVIGILQISVILTLYLGGRSFQLHASFNFMLVLTSLLFLYQQWLIKDRLPAACFRAFAHNQWRDF